MLERASVLYVVAVTGFSALAVQVILPRTLHPYFGSAGNVGSAVVAMSLAGLALGYYVGGFAVVNPARRIAAALGAGGAGFLFVAWVWTRLDGLAGSASTPRLLIAAAIVAFVPTVALGAVSPLAVRALRQRDDKRPSERPGLVFGLGTFANVVGGLTAGYWLVPFVGLTRSLVLLGGVLLITAGAVWLAGRHFPASDAAAGTTDQADAVDTEAEPDDSSEPADPAAPAGGFERWGLLVLAFYSGVASLAIEVSGTRMLASNFGPTTTLWASVLSVSLGGLATGYLIGGAIPRARMEQLLVGVIGTNSLFLLVSAWMLDRLGDSTPNASFGTLLTVTMIGFFPAFVMFGIESQLVVGIVADTHAYRGSLGATRATANVFAASTVGGLLGALSGVFFLLPVLGISLFVRLAAFGYLAVAALTVDRRRQLLAALAILAAIVPLPNWRWDDAPGVLLAQREGRQQTIRIYTDGTSYLRFHLGPTFESEVDLDTGLPRFGYAQRILGRVGDVTGKRVLVVGGAGHALARGFEVRGAVVTEVELDPEVVDASNEFFGPIVGEVVVADGRHYISHAPDASFDIVVIDAFDGPRVVPPHITTVEFYEEVSRILAADGRLYVNMIGSVAGDKNDSFLAMSSTVASVFDAAVHDGTVGNILLIAGNTSAPESLPPLTVQVTPNTDDLNPMEIMTDRSG